MRKARARKFKAQGERQARIRAAEGVVGALSLQIGLATGVGLPRGRTRTTGGGRSGQPVRRQITMRMPYRGGSRPVTFFQPPMSAVPQMRKDMHRAGLNVERVRAQVLIEGIQDSAVPVYLTVGSSRGRRFAGARGQRQAEIRNLTTANRAHQTRLHKAKNQLHTANLNILAFDRGVSVKNLKNPPAPPVAPFIIAGRARKLSILSKQSGFDVGLQLEKTNDRFGLDLTVDDVTQDFVSGGLLGEASNIFGRNRKIDKLKTTLKPEKPETVQLDEFSDFDLLLGRRANIVGQQKTRLEQINKVGDENLRIARIETELPLFNTRANEIDGLIGTLNTKITGLKKTRKPQELLSATGSLKSFGLKDLVSRRNQLTRIRNEKVDIFNTIKDPALRHVTKEQDIPQFDSRIFQLDSDIDKSVAFGQSRKQLDVGILNAPVKRRGRAPKTFDVTIGEQKRTFRRDVRGSRKAKQFFLDVKSRKRRELDAIVDPIEKAVAIDQDLGVLDLGLEATKVQGKVLKSEKRQELEALNIGGAVGGSSGFAPFTPSDTPTGKLQIQAIPKSRGVPAVFDQLDFGASRSRSRVRGRSRVNRNEFDLGELFGQRSGRTKIKRKQRGFVDFF